MATLDVTQDANLTNNTAPELTDRILFVDNGTGNLQDITPDNLLKIINSLTEDTTPDRAADYALVYDASASAVKKVLLNKMVGYEKALSTFNNTPADATTYYFGAFPGGTLGTAAGNQRVYIPFAGIIRSAYVFITCVAGSNEVSTMSIRLNDTTDTTISAAINLSASPFVVNNTGLNIAVAAGDWITIKWVTPTWATNPTVVSINVVLYIE